MTNHTSDDRSAFTIVWQPYEDQSPTGAPLSSQVSFPHFLDGANRQALTTGRPARLDAKTLSLGLLVAWDDELPFAERATQQQFEQTLRDLVVVMRAPSLERLILNAAAYLNESHGPVIGARALSTGRVLLRDSAMIASDLAMNHWAMAVATADAERAGHLADLAHVVDDIDFGRIHPVAAQLLAYARVVAAELADGAGTVEQSGTAAVPWVHVTWFVTRLRALLSGTWREQGEEWLFRGPDE